MFESIVLFIMGIFWAIVSLLIGFAGYMLIVEGHTGSGIVVIIIALILSTLIRG